MPTPEDRGPVDGPRRSQPRARIFGRARFGSFAGLDDRVVLLLLYLLSFWPLLVNNGIFWDDWVLYNQAPGTLTRMFSENGGPPAGGLDLALVSLWPVGAKWVIFFVFLAAMLVLYQILVEAKLFGREAALVITLLATVIPYSFARITTITAPYAVCYLLFLLAFLTLGRYLVKRRLALRVLALLLFFLSFGTNSLLVFYVVALMYIGNHERASLRSVRGVTRTLLSYVDFLLVPIAFFVMKSLFFVPYGIYANYNSISLESIKRSPREFVASLRSSFLDVIGSSLTSATGAVVVSLLLIAVAYALLVGRISESEPSANTYRVWAWRILLGGFLFFIGVLPYLAVGREGATFGTEWESRDQLLLGIGAAFMLYYGLKYLFGRFDFGAKPQRLVIAVLVASFVLANMTAYLQFQADWFKQVSLIENFRGMPEVRDNTTFAVDDRATALNAMNRHIQFYEYTGMLKQAFGTTTRLAAPASDIGAFSDPAFLATCVERPQYNLRDYVSSAPTHTIVIEVGGRGLSLASMARLLGEELLRPEAFREHVKQTLVVRVEPAQ